ncbi:hypothetical protein [Bradyrhizobium sp. 138]|nr:hypothetical protein [Bradyrhizobium sp. 138]
MDVREKTSVTARGGCKTPIKTNGKVMVVRSEGGRISCDFNDLPR